MTDEIELKEFRVWYTYTDDDYVDVQAENEEAAAEKAYDQTWHDNVEITGVEER